MAAEMSWSSGGTIWDPRPRYTLYPLSCGGLCDAVTITPAARAGTVVHGVIYLVTSPFTGIGNLSGALAGGLGAVQTSGDVLAALPYTYTVG